MTSDEQFMSRALELASLAAIAGDVPVGAVIVDDSGLVIGEGFNRRESDGDPTAHAEVVALRDAAKTLGIWRVEATLYVTHEPCCMCAGAIVNARVKRLVFGCDNPKAGGVKSLFEICTDARLNHRVMVTGGVLATECANELKRFFEQLRAGPSYR